jgi:Leucine-rich repeat (LRR) protein
MVNKINMKIVCIFFVAVIIVISGSLIYLSVKQNLVGPAKPGQNQVLSSLTEAQARTIAEATCIKGGNALKSGGTYNSNSNTWWFDANLNATKPGCNPACVVSAETKKAEVNWRCTGAIPPAGQEEGTTLDLSNKGLNKLPMDIFNQTDLTGLNVSGNKLTGSLPSQLGNLKKLKFLDASNNQYTGIPAEIGQLSDLETANFSYNAITGLPLEIGNLKKLKTIDLTSNDYSTYDLSKIKQALPNLQVIGEKKY